MKYFWKKPQSKGMTIIEFLGVIAIFSLLASSSFLSMTNLIQNQLVVSTIGELSSDIQFARAEAVSKKTTVELCPSSDGNSCTKTDEWINGWIVYIKDSSRCPGNNDCILKSRGSFSPTLTLNASISGVIGFNEHGNTSSGVMFALCPFDSRAPQDDAFQRTLSLTASGSKHIRQGASTCNP